MKLPITIYGQPVLRKKCASVEVITEEIYALVHSMIETMDEGRRGIGLAAPQVGKSLKIFVLRRYIIQPDGKWDVSEPFVYINPKIVWHSDKTWVDEEGCLSIPKIRLPVERPWAIRVEGMDLEGNTFTHELEGLNARVVLHENDHINGVLFIDRVEPRYLKEVSSDLQKMKKKGKGLSH